MIDTVHASIALGPLAIYLIVLGMLHLSARPKVTSGGRDFAALGLGLSGFVIIGPMHLFFPDDAASNYGWGIWPLLTVFYWLGLTLAALTLRPRLVIYNISHRQLKPLVESVTNHLDTDAHGAGDGLLLPNAGIHLYLDSTPIFHNAEIVSIGAHQNFDSWHKLEHALICQLKDLRNAKSRYAFMPLSLGLGIISTIMFWVVRDPRIAQELLDFFAA
ncbi:MAG: hypothetical protein MK165_12980 [Pirellulaceae bacterium]|nr:hypothetical protein [Pirellulaceae bacterium]